MKSNIDKCHLLPRSSNPDQKIFIIHKLVIPLALATSLNVKLNNYLVKKQFLSNKALSALHNIFFCIKFLAAIKSV